MNEMTAEEKPRSTKSRLPWILLAVAAVIILILIIVIIILATKPGRFSGSDGKVKNKVGWQDDDGGGVTKTHTSIATIARERDPTLTTATITKERDHTTRSTVSPRPSSTASATIKPTFISHPGESFAAIERDSFIKVEHMKSLISPDGRLDLQPSLETAKMCREACSAQQACFGVDFETSSKSCFFITDQNYELQEATGYINYRHLFKGKTTCGVYFLHFADRKPLNRSVPVAQPAYINSPEACKSSSLGQYSNTEGPTGMSYAFVMFDKKERRCYLYETFPGEEDDAGWDLYRQDLRCHPAQQPDCMDTLFRFANKTPGPSLGVEYLPQPEVTSFMECEEASYNFREPIYRAGEMIGYRMSAGFLYNRSTGECNTGTNWELPLLGANDYLAGADSDFYIYSRYCGRCEDLYSEVSPGFISNNGTQVIATTLERCRTTCLEKGTGWNRHEPRCYGFDFLPSQHSCRLNFDRNYKMAPMSGSTNYRRTTICQADKCLRLPSYIPTINTLPPGGVEIEPEGSAADSHTPLLRCAFSCQGNVYVYDRIKLDRRTCYGFAFNTATGKCFLYYDFDYEIRDVGNDEGFVTYRRKYTCRDNDYCSDTYTSSPGWHAVVKKSNDQGILQPWDINTLERCKDRCWGYSIGTLNTCHALDFNYTSNKCTLYTTSDYDLEPGSGTDHYRRDMKCQLNL